MALRILQVQQTLPLEREYEGWITHSVERYFWTIGVHVNIWAVSPNVEKYWPADEVLSVDSKLIGIQMKRAKLGTASGPISLSHLKWELGSPSGQLALVQQIPEIYYCLPTFTNRDWRHSPLGHCLFWRPNQSSSDKNAWYDNPAAATSYCQLAKSPEAYRWGRFYELVTSCSIGKVLPAGASAVGYVQELAYSIRSQIEIAQSENMPVSEAITNGLYLVQVPLNAV